MLVLVHGLLMNRRMFERLGPELARRRQPGDLRRPARPRALGPARGSAALLDAALRPPGGGAARPPRARLGGGGRDLARRQRRASSWRCATRSGPAASSSRCRSSTTPCPRSPAPSPRCCSACGYGRPAFELASRAHLAAAAHQLPGRHRARLGAPAPRPLRRGAGGPAAGGDGAASREAARDRAADPDRRPPARPGAPLQRLRHAGRGAAQRAPGRGRARSSSGG